MMTVEAALVLPLLILITFGLIEYGWLFLKAQQINNAARHGARLAVTPDATTAQVQEAIDALMAEAGLGDSGYTKTISPANVSDAAPQSQVSVTVSVPYQNIEIAGVPLIPVPSSLVGSVTMAKEGP